MTSKLFSPIRIFLLLTTLHALQAQKSITLDDCFTYYTFYPNTGVNFQYLADGQHYIEADNRGNLHVRDIRNEKSDSLIVLSLPAEAREFDQYELSDDESKLLLRTETESVYRHSVRARYFVYDLKTKKCTPVFGAKKLQYAVFSPDAQSVAFVLDNNVFIRQLSKSEPDQVTSDGLKNHIINGLPDWLYEEEFSPVDGDGMLALKFSPDSKRLAFIRFDETAVPEFKLNFYEGVMYPRQDAYKFPKVGEPNSAISVHCYDVQENRMLGRLMGFETDDYCPRMYWTPDNNLVAMRLNRRQDTLELLQAMPDRAIYDEDDEMYWIPVRPVLRETDAAYVDVEMENKLVFLEKRPNFLWMSDRDGWNHVYRYPAHPAAAETPVLLTPGNFDITAFYGVDEQKGKFYFQAATPTPLDRQIWEGSLDGAPARLLTPPTGTHDASFNPSFDYFTHVWSDANTPPVVSICDRNDDTIRVITRNERIRKLRTDYGFARKEFFDFSLADGTRLNGWIMRPTLPDPTKKYPVLVDIYGGPGSQTVQNQYDGYMNSWHQMLVQKGIAVVSIDNRGTGARGRDFRKCTQLQLGKLETEDQIAAARYLSTLPWVDPARIGIWGWSFGGYLSTSCILKGADVFKMAMAVAPVTNWKWYDSAYTERYMHTTTDNAAGYEANSPVNFARLLKGGNYLLCHGMADDNVHWQQSVEMINALIQANKQFDTYYYPNRNHGIYGDNATIHLFTKLTDFLMEKL